MNVRTALVTLLALPACIGSAQFAIGPAEPGPAGPQWPAVRINEIAPDGDPTAEGTGDWLELTVLDGPVDLDGWTISDDWTDPGRHPLPAEALLPGEHRLLPAGVGAGEDRLPFGLAAQGEGVGVFAPDGAAVDWLEFGPAWGGAVWARLPDGTGPLSQQPRGTPGEPNTALVPVQTELVPAGAIWRFHDAGFEPPGWTEADFDDRAWDAGAAPLGYGDPVATELSAGPDPAARSPSLCLRTSFEVAAGASIAELTVEARVDDGVRLLLDGAELIRHNLPEGPVGFETWATQTVSGPGELAWITWQVPVEGLAAGPHALAAEVHQASPDSSDVLFDLALGSTGWVAP